MEGKRPWEMTCIVTGFPSKVAALQFEWAWQNTHATRHIDFKERTAGIAAAQKAGKRYRPPMSLEARLKNLHRLLGVKSFRRWPLHIRFFASDVFELWEKYTRGGLPELGKHHLVQLTPARIEPTTSFPKAGEPEFKVPALIQEIPVAYQDCKAYIESSNVALDKGSVRCGVCKRKAEKTSTLLLVCPIEGCLTISHVGCLASVFLREEGAQVAIIPTQGHCPGCRTLLQWSRLVKELSLRTRGCSEVEALFKTQRRGKARVDETEAVSGSAIRHSLGEEDQESAEDIADVEAELEEEFPSIEKFLKLEIEDLRRATIRIPATNLTAKDQAPPGNDEEDAESEDDFPSIDTYLRKKGNG
jgi:structure-specific endonuclease subunit SLX1